jgi:hypothetical protein
VNKIKRLWNSVSGKLAPLAEEGTEAQDITAIELRRMLRRCPVCGGGFEEHVYALFAMTVLGEDRRGRVREFLDACEDREWEEAIGFQEFDDKRDAIVAYAMRCSTGRLAVLIERSPVGSYEPDRLIACDVIDEAEGRRLEGLIDQNDWRRLNWT